MSSFTLRVPMQPTGCRGKHFFPIVLLGMSGLGVLAAQGAHASEPYAGAEATGAPAVSAVLNGASYGGDVSPGSWVAIYGSNLAPSTASAQSVPLGTQLNGVTVTVGGVSAPLLYVSATQINALVPFEVPVAVAPIPVVVTTGAGASSPAYVQVASAATPGLFTLNGSGTGGVIAFNSSFQFVNTIGTDPIVLYAAGLGPTNPPGSSTSGGASTEPFNRITQPLQVFLGDQPATVLFAGLAPGFPGIYQLNVQPNGASTDRVYLRSGGWQSNITQIGMTAGASVSNVTGLIAGLYPASANLPSSYETTPFIQPVSFSVMTVVGVLNVQFDIAANAQPFDVVATSEAATAMIHFDTASGTYTATLTVPTAAARVGNFQSTEFAPILDLGTCSDGGGMLTSYGCVPFPGNIIPESRLDPNEISALNYLPNPTATTAGSANATVVTTGTFTPGTFAIDANSHPELTVFGGFFQIPFVGAQTRTTAFSLYVDGKLIASQTATYTVEQ